MKITNRNEVKVSRIIYDISDVKEYGNVVYIEYVNEHDRVIDVDLRDENGFSIDNPDILNDIQEAVDTFEGKTQ
jgi:hypothetical protein